MIKKSIVYKSWNIHFDWIEQDHVEFTDRQYKKIEKITTIIKTPKVIYDVGSNIGMYSLFFRHFWPDAEIYSFEALKDTAEIAMKNLENSNVTVFNYGLWDSETEILLGVPKGFDIQSTNYGFYWNSIQDYDVKVDVKTLNSVISTFNRVPDFLKIDVEGAEINVLRGGSEYLKQIKYIMVEYNRPYLELPAPETVHELLISEGFEVLSVLDSFDKIYINTKYA
jgi:FkbM family methyltransferase